LQNSFVAKFTADNYQKFMQAWENELNNYLDTNKTVGALKQ